MFSVGKIKVDGIWQQVKKGELFQGLKGLVTGDDITKVKEHLSGIGNHETIGGLLTFGKTATEYGLRDKFDKGGLE